MHNPFISKVPATKGVHLTVRGLRYEVPLKGGGSKTLIEGVDVQVQPGAILALMGASGAGKSTLLNLLGQRISTGTTAGSVAINGEPIDPTTFPRLCGFVTQDVPFLEFLTVRETLSYAARLRLPGSLSAEAKHARVAEVIALLDLGACAETRVGKAAEPGGISGGERRRLAMACEMLFDPQLLLLDEVTSGLDSASAMRIALIMRRLADAGKTIITTIHQPRPEVMACFTQVMLLAQGRIAYYGPSVDGGLLGYFEGAGYTFPHFANPSDYMLDLVNADHEAEGAMASSGGGVGGGGSHLQGGGPLAAGGSRVAAASALEAGLALPSAAATPGLVDAGSPPPVATGGVSAPPPSRRQLVVDHLTAYYEASQLAVWARTDPPAFPPPAVPNFGGTGGGRYPTSWFTQQWVVCERAFLYKLRNPDAVASQFVAAVVLAVIVGSVFLHLPLTMAGARDRLSAIAFIMLTQAFVAIDQVIVMPQERAVMLRDSESGAYSTSAFFFGRTNAEWPIHSLFAVIVAVVTHFMFGLRASQLGVYVLVHVLVINTGAALLTLIGAMSRTMAMGNGLATLVLVFASLFNSFYVSVDNVPVVYRWLFDVSFPAFGVRAGAYNELAGLSFTCSPDELAVGCTGRGEDLLHAFGIPHVDVWRMCGLLMLETIIFRLLAFLAIHFMYTGQPLRQRWRTLCT